MKCANHVHSQDLTLAFYRVDKESEQTFFTLGHFYDTMAFPDSGGSARENGGGGRGSVIANKEDAVHLKEAIKHYAQSLMLVWSRAQRLAPVACRCLQGLSVTLLSMAG